MVFFSSRVFYEFASPVTQYQFECFVKRTMVFCFSFFASPRRLPNSAFIFLPAISYYRTQMLPD